MRWCFEEKNKAAGYTGVTIVELHAVNLIKVHIFFAKEKDVKEALNIEFVTNSTYTSITQRFIASFFVNILEGCQVKMKLKYG